MQKPCVVPAVNRVQSRDGEFALPSDGNIMSCIAKKQDLSVQGEEAYRLEIAPDGITIFARCGCGFFRGFQTVKQLVKTSKNGKIPCMEIEDSPRFAYRAFMIDSARHMQSIEELMRMIDAAALLKFNVFHWHISDDQGFRFESKKYPELNRIGSYRIGDSFGKTMTHELYGGYYTREEMAKIVRYCASKYIDVIPELDMPGHVSAILASYPFLSCKGQPIPVRTSNGIYTDILCAGKDETYQFIYDLLDELMEVFPSKYIHIGGDEAPKLRWYQCDDCVKAMREQGLKNAEELQGVFTLKIAEYLQSKGKKAIVWNESLHSGMLPENVTVQYWTGDRAPAVRHLGNGGSVINSDFFHYYADYPYGMTPLAKTYRYEPIFADADSASRENLIGVEMPIWTEFICDAARMQELAFPRLAAVAETAWTQKKNKRYADFKRRAVALQPVLKEMGVVGAARADWDPDPVSAMIEVQRFFAHAKSDTMKLFLRNKKEAMRLAEELGFAK